LVCLALLFFGVALGGGSREHIVPVGTLVAAIIGGAIALGQLQVARQRHDAQTEADLQRRITESFTKAVEQLGSEHLPVRVGGIYALERISRESSEDYWTVMETLTAFVRERARWKELGPADDTSSEARHEVPTDVAAVLSVIRRRSQQNRQNWEREQREGWRLDLRSTDLRGADLGKAHLERAILKEACLNKANLEGAYLRKADLSETHLKGASFWKAYLEEADLCGAHLERAIFMQAHLEEAIFWTAHLERANFRGAHLEGVLLIDAHLEGADLRMSIDLPQDQIDVAFGNAETQLPEGMDRPDHWK
jgi:hypothetical protein